MLGPASNMDSGLAVPVIEPPRTFTQIGSEMNNNIKIGFDIHGVIDNDPNFFATLISRLREQDHEVHILTGRELDGYIVDKLSDLGISYDQLFSITTYHKSIGTYISYKNGDPSQPLIAPPKWDRTKADYANSVGLDLHIDDSVVYGQHFRNISTQYLIYTPAVRTFLHLLLDRIQK
jgi:hypothetical protein